MRCNSCGYENAEGAIICAGCGMDLASKLESETTIVFNPVETEESEAPVKVEAVSEEAVFVVKRGSVVGQRFPLLKSEISLGRDPQSDIFLDDITVSRKHAKVNVQKSAVKVTDVGSLNGTYVNGDRVDAATLRHGDELQIGKFKLIFLEGKT